MQKNFINLVCPLRARMGRGGGGKYFSCVSKKNKRNINNRSKVSFIYLSWFERFRWIIYDLVRPRLFFANLRSQIIWFNLKLTLNKIVQIVWKVQQKKIFVVKVNSYSSSSSSLFDILRFLYTPGNWKPKLFLLLLKEHLLKTIFVKYCS